MRDFVSTPWEAPYRGLDTTTLEQYGISRTDGGITVFQYRDSSGKRCANKYRNADKSRVWWDGDVSAVSWLS